MAPSYRGSNLESQRWLKASDLAIRLEGRIRTHPKGPTVIPLPCCKKTASVAPSRMG